MGGIVICIDFYSKQVYLHHFFTLHALNCVNSTMCKSMKNCCYVSRYHHLLHCEHILVWIKNTIYVALVNFCVNLVSFKCFMHCDHFIVGHLNAKYKMSQCHLAIIVASQQHQYSRTFHLLYHAIDSFSIISNKLHHIYIAFN